MISTVLWDADGVLQRIPGGFEESMRPALDGWVSGDDATRFLAEALVAERPCLEGRESWVEVLPRLLQRWRIPEAYDAMIGVWLTIEAVPGTREVVDALRSQGIRCCLATNQDVTRAHHMKDALGYERLLDLAFYSCDLRAAKPDAAYFHAVLDRLDETPDRVLFVDDSRPNVDVARDLGLAAEQWVHHDGLDALHALLAGHGLSVA